jgi:hypothetical protein
MSEAVTIEVLIITRLVFIALIVAGFGLLTWMIQRGISKGDRDRKDTNEKIEKQQKAHTECREELATRFALRGATNESFHNLHEKLNSVAVDIAFIKGKVNGGITIPPAISK